MSDRARRPRLWDRARSRTRPAPRLGATLRWGAFAGAGVTLLVLAVVGSIIAVRFNRTVDRDLATSRSELEAQSLAASLAAEARSAGQDVGLVLQPDLDAIVAWSGRSELVDGAVATGQVSAAGGLGGLDPDELGARFPASTSIGAAPATSDFLARGLADRPAIVEAVFTDASGVTGGSIGPVGAGLTQRDELWWQEAWAAGLSIGPPELRIDSGRYVLPVASRIDDGQGVPVGVLRASIDLTPIQQLVADRQLGDLRLIVTTADRLVLADSSADGAAGPSDEVLSDGPGTRIVGGTVYAVELVPSSASGPAGTGSVDGGWLIVASRPATSPLSTMTPFESLHGRLADARREAAGLAAVAAAAAVLLSLVVALWTGSRAVRPVSALARAARAEADDLPRALAHLVTGGSDHGHEPVGRASDPVPLASTFGGVAELASIGRAIDSMRRTAHGAAIEGQARDDHHAQVVVSIGRRGQAMARQALRMLDQLDAGPAASPDGAVVDELDHLLTRSRRKAESLLVLAGETTKSRRTTPVPVGRIVLGAVGEVEDHRRVDASSIEPVLVAGWVATDLAHLVAELVENGLAASPADSLVEVSGQRIPDGYQLAVTDHGVGMTPESLAAANRVLSDGPGTGTPLPTDLGLPVVARLASRHGIVALLRPRAAGGIQAEISIPTPLITVGPDRPEPPPVSLSRPTPTPTSTPTATPTAAPTARPVTRSVPLAPQQALWADDATAAPTPPDPPSHRLHPAAGPGPSPEPALEPTPEPALEPTPEPAPEPEYDELSPASARYLVPVSPRTPRGVDGPLDQLARTPGRQKRPVAMASAEDAERQALALRNRWDRFHQGRRAGADPALDEQSALSPAAAPGGVEHDHER